MTMIARKQGTNKLHVYDSLEMILSAFKSALWTLVGRPLKNPQKSTKGHWAKTRDSRNTKSSLAQNANSTARKTAFTGGTRGKRARKEGRKEGKECGDARDSREGSNSLKTASRLLLPRSRRVRSERTGKASACDVLSLESLKKASNEERLGG